MREEWKLNRVGIFQGVVVDRREDHIQGSNYDNSVQKIMQERKGRFP